MVPKPIFQTRRKTNSKLKALTLIIFIIPVSLFSQNLDVKLLESIHTPTDLPSDAFFRNVSSSYRFVLYGGTAGMAIVGLAKKDNDLLHKCTIIAASNLINTAITQGLKYSVQRDRPFVDYPNLFMDKTKREKMDPSFPSGHTSTSFATATSLSLLHPEWYVVIPSYLWAGTVAYSRFHLGVHYPTDAIAGAMIGMGSAYLTFFLNKKLLK